MMQNQELFIFYYIKIIIYKETSNISSHFHIKTDDFEYGMKKIKIKNTKQKNK